MTKEEQFNVFWIAYPNKKGKLDAQKAFEKAIKKTTLEAMLEAIRAYKIHKPEWQSFKHPSTWLHAGSWDDEWEQKSQLAAFGARPGQTRDQYIADAIRRNNSNWH